MPTNPEEPAAVSVALTAAYYAQVARADLQGRSPAAVAGTVRCHRELAIQRLPHTALVRVWTPAADTDGFSVGHTVVDVVVEDMPYLVDSLLAELSRLGRGIRLLAHPILSVRRDLDGTLIEVPVEGGGAPEAWVHVEIDRLAGEADLQARLQQVLADVRAAVEDGPAMLARARELTSALPAGEEADLLRWVADNRLALLGYARIEAGKVSEGLGLLRGADPAPDAVPEGLLSIARASRRSTVQRSVFPEVVTVRWEGVEHRFTGLLSAAAAPHSVLTVPLLRSKAAAVLEASGHSPDSHSGLDLLAILEAYPTSELFQASLADLRHVTREVQLLGERRQLRLFLRRDDAGRFMSCLVYLPRDLYTRAVRLRLQEVLGQAFEAESVDYTVRVTDSVLARLLIVVHAAEGATVPDVDALALEQHLAQVASSWLDELAAVLRTQLGEDDADALIGSWVFPAAYQADFAPDVAARDLQRLQEMTDGLTMTLYRPAGHDLASLRLSVLSVEPLTLSAALPVLAHMAVEVADSRPYELRASTGEIVYLYDIGLRAVGELYDAQDGLDTLFRDAFTAVWTGAAEDDGYNALVLRGGLGWRQVAVLRAYGAYLRQSGWTYSPEYVEASLLSEVEIARLLTELFQTRFEPDPSLDRAERSELVARLEQHIVSTIDGVAGADDDRILRAFLAVILATVRTNAYQRTENGEPHDHLAFKLDPSAVPELPRPRPRHEIWVHSSRLEGVHLRFGAVARGGLRWSDRREDFRAEVLGLVKAQTVKNAVIVPVGAKGGFVGKRLPPASERDDWLAEGIACYATFICALLDLTDNRVDGEVVPPERVVRWDGDDPYLVVAADKGTAAFSDIANRISVAYGFWLGDAFASGGSAGYDHKAMGITARGGWVSVRRHLRELGVDAQSEEVTAVGIGDMSGDVFGNGMLRSRHLRLVAAFDHRHVFLDPDPDAAVSYDERARLAALARSSWQDYDPALISEGGGVYPRTAKTVPISEPVRARLDLPAGVTSLTVPRLLKAILRAPVDLLWNGAIGTYVKASTETHAEVGDRANDAVRLDGLDLRCRVIGEGGNLGLTQRGRIEAARHGVRLNTDAIDNCAGVDCSDHEVNIKILLSACLREGSLDRQERDRLLVSMTEDVASSVLQHNVDQNLMLSIARAHAPAMLTVHRRMLASLEQSGVLDRELEALPTSRELDQRAAADQGLTSPELAVLAGYAKITLKSALLATDLPTQAWTYPWLLETFPSVLVERFEPQITQHPLRAEIVATALTNDLVNRGGASLVFRVQEETAASTPEVMQAYAVVRQVFDLPQLSNVIEAAALSTDTSVVLHLMVRRLLDRAVRWLLHRRRNGIDVQAEIDRFGPPLARLLPQVPELVRGAEASALSGRTQLWQDDGVPAELALRIGALLHAFPLLPVIDLDPDPETSVEAVAELQYSVAAELGVDRLLERISALPRADRWAGLARSALREDTYTALTSLTADVLASTPAGTPQERIASWRPGHERQLAAAFQRLEQIAAGDSVDLATLTVAVRTFRSLLPT